jgi:hypothetical protein
LIVRRKFKEFAELRRRIDGLIAVGLPAERIGGDQQTNYIRFANGAQIKLDAIDRVEKTNDHVGQQYCEISIDEVTTFPFFYNMVDKLKGSLRSPDGVPCHMFGTGNPGGPGHMAVKEYFKLGSVPDGINVIAPETVMTYELTKGFTETRIYIPSFLDDNKIFCANDPNYVARLKSISDEQLRKAWIDGNWDIFIGQAFNLTDRHKVKTPIWPIPPGAPMIMTFDWGYDKPFSVGWWWVDYEGRLYRFNELYGCTLNYKVEEDGNKITRREGGDNSGKPNEGLKIVDSLIAKMIIDKEKKMGIWNRRHEIDRLCDPTCHNKKPMQPTGPTTADVFADYGIPIRKGDPDRVSKIRQFRERLGLPADNLNPMLMYYPNCHDFERIVRALCMDEDKIDDVDTDMEDHAYDEACHAVMSRPLSMPTRSVLPRGEHFTVEDLPPETDLNEQFWPDEGGQDKYVPLDDGVGF